jgi:hypothetical protein
MLSALAKKIVSVTPPAAIVNNASLTCAEIDTLGADLVEIIVDLGATDIALTVLKVQETDTTGAGYADIATSIFGTALNDTGVASVLPSATDDNHLFSFLIDCRGGRKRFLKPVVTFGNGAAGGFATVFAELSRLEAGPRLAVNCGFTERLII